MEEPSQRDLECFKVLLPGMYADKLKLLDEMPEAIGARRKLELCLDDDQVLARWEVEVFPDGSHMYLRRGWNKIASLLDLHDGYTLVLRYDGHSQINIKVFDRTTCRKKYEHTSVVASRTLSLPIPEPMSFAIILKNYHLKAKYLAKNVPVDYEKAHGYSELGMVTLRIAGQSFVVALQRTITNKKVRISFKYGWDDFCAKNNLKVGDTCFFSVIRGHTWCFDDDEEWEEYETKFEAMLKVEVRRTNG